MKKILFISLFSLGTAFSAKAQDYVRADYYTPPASTFYLGFGGGINNYLGLIGPSVEYQVAPKFTLFGGLGLGSWGNKISAGARYYGNFPEKWAFGLGISVSSGLDHIEYDMPAEYIVGGQPGTNPNGASNEVRVPFRLQAASTLNLSAGRYWTLGSSGKNRFNIELGYALPIGVDPYETKNNAVLTREGKYFMSILQPGGFNLGLGFSFGLN